MITFREKLRVVAEKLALDACDDLFNDFTILQHLHMQADNLKDNDRRNKLKECIEDLQTEVGDTLVVE